MEDAFVNALKQFMNKQIELAEKSDDGLPYEFQATATLTDGLTVEVKARHFSLVLDQPPGSCGLDRGPNPEEVMLGAIAACQAMTAQYYAALLNTPLKHYEVKMNGKLEESGFFGVDLARQGFESVTCDTHIESDAPLDDVKELQRIVEERCAAHATLRRSVNVTSNTSYGGHKVRRWFLPKTHPPKDE